MHLRESLTERTYSDAILCLLSVPPLIYLGNPALALIVGMSLTLIFDRKIIENGNILSKYFLQSAIILLGFKLNIAALWQTSASYTMAVAVYVGSAMGFGLLLGTWLKLERSSNILMAAGTAICGGTTIATLAPIIKARPEQMGTALAIVFLLNAIALFIFPYIGQWLNMSQEQFGIWVALAIHDTSSVVATARIYGEEAMQIATTVKLGRTLWLIPMVLMVSFWAHSAETKIRVPLFILFFIAASVAGTFISLPGILLASTTWLSRALLVIALFLIGTEISRTTLRALRGRILVQALILWILVVPITMIGVLTWVE